MNRKILVLSALFALLGGFLFHRFQSDEKAQVRKKIAALALEKKWAHANVLASEYLAADPGNRPVQSHLARSFKGLEMEAQAQDICDEIMEDNFDETVTENCRPIVMPPLLDEGKAIHRALSQRTSPLPPMKCDSEHCPFIGKTYGSFQDLCSDLVAWSRTDAGQEPVKGEEWPFTCDWFETANSLSQNSTAPEGLPAGLERFAIEVGPQKKLGLVDVGPSMLHHYLFVVWEAEGRFGALDLVDLLYNPGAFGIFNYLEMYRFEPVNTPSGFNGWRLEYGLTGVDNDGGINRVMDYDDRYLKLCGEQGGKWACSPSIPLSRSFCLALEMETEALEEASQELYDQGILPLKIEQAAVADPAECGYPTHYLSHVHKIDYEWSSQTGEITFTDNGGKASEEMKAYTGKHPLTWFFPE